mmetsp:Transcript_34043/g.98046  ORF Transcript_34043/g.98046 Transcript_34043/m.98046 type:complete len:358 (+) Transcript_34043:192-1265(+)
MYSRGSLLSRGVFASSCLHPPPSSVCPHLSSTSATSSSSIPLFIAPLALFITSASTSTCSAVTMKLALLTVALAIAIWPASSAPSGLRGGGAGDGEHRKLNPFKKAADGLSNAGQQVADAGQQYVDNQRERVENTVDAARRGDVAGAVQGAKELAEDPAGVGDLQEAAGQAASRVRNEIADATGVDGVVRTTRGEKKREINEEYEPRCDESFYSTGCGDVLWGKMIDEKKYAEGITAIVADILGGAGTFTLQYLVDMVTEQVEAIYGDMQSSLTEFMNEVCLECILREVIKNRGDITSLELTGLGMGINGNGETLKTMYMELKFDVLTYKREGCVADVCTPLPNHHQPYLAFKLKTS